MYFIINKEINYREIIFQKTKKKFKSYTLNVCIFGNGKQIFIYIKNKINLKSRNMCQTTYAKRNLKIYWLLYFICLQNLKTHTHVFVYYD